jgi:hypothetical protein
MDNEANSEEWRESCFSAVFKGATVEIALAFYQKI